MLKGRCHETSGPLRAQPITFREEFFCSAVYILTTTSRVSFSLSLLLIKLRLGDFLSHTCLKPTLHSRNFLVTFPADASRNRVTPPSAKFVAAFITLHVRFSEKFYFPLCNRPSTVYTRPIGARWLRNPPCNVSRLD